MVPMQLTRIASGGIVRHTLRPSRLNILSVAPTYRLPLKSAGDTKGTRSPQKRSSVVLGVVPVTIVPRLSSRCSSHNRSLIPQLLQEGFQFAGFGVAFGFDGLGGSWLRWRVSPLQGLEIGWGHGPRALPWAGMFRPVGAEESPDGVGAGDGGFGGSWR